MDSPTHSIPRYPIATIIPRSYGDSGPTNGESRSDRLVLFPLSMVVLLSVSTRVPLGATR